MADPKLVSNASGWTVARSDAYTLDVSVDGLVETVKFRCTMSEAAALCAEYSGDPCVLCCYGNYFKQRTS